MEPNNINNTNKERHEFAFFLEEEIFKNLNISEKTILKQELSSSDKKTPCSKEILSKKQEITINNQELFHRISNIIRLEIGQKFILFNQTHNAKLELVSLEKKKIICANLLEIKQNKIIEPKINFLLPILKREDLESAIYACTELGANKIITLNTNKSQKIFNIDRAIKITISAAEQSKNFAFSKIALPIDLVNYINSKKGQNSIDIFFDSEGESLHDVVKKISEIKNNLESNLCNNNDKKNSFEINLMIGPEGDLTEAEKELIKNSGFIFCKLTPTILRACQAVNIALGSFRSLL